MRLDSRFNLDANGHRIALDTSGSHSDSCFVSHAHADHTGALKSRKNKIIASEETVALAGRSADRISSLEFDGTKAELLPSGHMLGARQLRVECGGESFTYTGDFKLDKSLTAEEAEVRETDVLMIEGTFGDPAHEFPEREEVYDAISFFIKKNYEAGNIVLLGGYALGKAQELVAITNRLCSLKPVVSERIGRACRVYSDFGVRLDAAVMGTPEAEELMESNFVAVMPFHEVNYGNAVAISRKFRRSVYSAIATGWAKSMRFPVDVAFPLSDHADFKDILGYVEAARPKTVYCCHGNEETLSRELRRRGINASGLGEKSAQATICGW